MRPQQPDARAHGDLDPAQQLARPHDVASHRRRITWQRRCLLVPLVELLDLGEAEHLAVGCHAVFPGVTLKQFLSAGPALKEQAAVQRKLYLHRVRKSQAGPTSEAALTIN